MTSTFSIFLIHDFNIFPIQMYGGGGVGEGGGRGEGGGSGGQQGAQEMSPLHFLCTQCLQPLQKMLLLPTPVQQTAHGNSPELCRRSRPVPQIMILVFPAFTLSPYFSIASFQVKSLPDTFLERFSDDNMVIGIEVLPGDLRAELS